LGWDHIFELEMIRLERGFRKQVVKSYEHGFILPTITLRKLVRSTLLIGTSDLRGQIEASAHLKAITRSHLLYVLVHLNCRSGWND
jgi:hypothetical protein